MSDTGSAPEDRDLAPRSGAGGDHDLAEEVSALHKELAHLRRHRMVYVYQSVWRVLMFKFASGMAVGLGTVIGATVLLSLIVWALSQIEFLPIIGAWSAEIARQIEEAVGNGN